MILLIIILAIFLFIGWILFAPLILTVNTETEEYSVRLPGIFSGSVIKDEGKFYLRIRVLFIPFKIHPGRLSGKEREKKPGRKPIRIGSVKYGVMAFREIIRSFRFRLLYIDIDTEDTLLNACLAPALMLVRAKQVRVNVNFMEQNTLIMDLRNRLANFIWIGIKYKYRLFVKP
jgi:hypothetical protein